MFTCGLDNHFLHHIRLLRCCTKNRNSESVQHLSEILWFGCSGLFSFLVLYSVSCLHQGRGDYIELTARLLNCALTTVFFKSWGCSDELGGWGAKMGVFNSSVQNFLFENLDFPKSYGRCL